MESCERATSDLFSAMSLSKGYWCSLFDLDDNSFSLSHLFGVSIDELLNVFEIIGFVKNVEKKGSQFMRFKFTNFINQNGLDELAEHSVFTNTKGITSILFDLGTGATRTGQRRHYFRRTQPQSHFQE